MASTATSPLLRPLLVSPLNNPLRGPGDWSRGAAARLWLPSDLGVNLLSWHKKDTATVSAWPDSSGNGLTFVQATGANQPIVNVAGGLDLSSARYMGCTSLDAGSGAFIEGMVSCWTVADTTTDKSILRGVAGGSRDISAESSARFWITKIAVTSIVEQDPYPIGKNIGTTLCQPVLTGISIGINGNTLSVRSPDGTTAFDGAGIETRLGGRGDITVHEMVRFHSQNTSAADRYRVEGYVAWNNGAQASLVVGHPYKAAAPTF